MKHLIRIGALAGVMALLAIGAAASVSAHAELDHSDPADGAVLATSPAKVTLTFIEEIQHTSGSYGIEVKNAAGTSVTSGAATIGSDDMSLSIALKPNLPNGVYNVTWSNLSVDGDALTDEEFSFTVGTASAAPTPAPAATPHTHAADPSAADHHAAADAEPPTVGLLVANVVPQNGSNVGGRIEIIPAEGGEMTEVGVYLTGLAADSSHKAHIHVASTCFEGAHAADLDTISSSDAGFGSSVTAVEVPFSTVANGNHVVLVHAGAGDGAADEQVIACGIIPAQPDAHDAHAAIRLPSTGTAAGGSNGFATSAMLAALIIAGTMIVAGGVTIASKRR